MKNSRSILSGRISFWGKEILFILGTLVVVGSCMPSAPDVTYEFPPTSQRISLLVPQLSPAVPIQLHTTASENLCLSDFNCKDPAQLCLESDTCRKLAEVGYHEARSEDNRGVLATLFVVLNRVEHPSYPESVYAVVHQRKQFSYIDDGSVQRGFKETKEYRRILHLSYEVLQGKWESVIGEATHYHTTAIRPSWSRQLNLYTTIGNHRFYSL